MSLITQKSRQFQVEADFNLVGSVGLQLSKTIGNYLEYRESTIKIAGSPFVIDSVPQGIKLL